MEHRNVSLLLAGIFVTITVGGIVDLILDQPTGLLTPHVLFEVTMVVVSLASALYLGIGWARTQRSLVDVERHLADRSQERDDWRHRTEALVRGLGEEIDRQFEIWELTPSERQTVLFLLKGLSHKEIARLTDRSEKTVRQHAVNSYRKAGLGGRAELSAFFLEDLLQPIEEREAPGQMPRIGASR